MTIEVGAIGKPPSHYAGDGLQPFDIIDAFGLDFYEGSALKYLLRWRKKDGMADLKKARHYLDEIIAREEKRLDKIGLTCTCKLSDPGFRCPMHK